MPSNEKVVTDPDVYTQLSFQQRVLTVLKIAGHSSQQIANLMHPHSHTGVLINNIATCREPQLREQCLTQKQACEGELMVNRPSGDNPRWTVLEELELIIAVSGSSDVPRRLQQAFDAINALQADLV